MGLKISYKLSLLHYANLLEKAQNSIIGGESFPIAVQSCSSIRWENILIAFQIYNRFYSLHFLPHLQVLITH